MGSDVTPDVSALAINVTIPEGLRGLSRSPDAVMRSWESGRKILNGTTLDKSPGHE